MALVLSITVNMITMMYAAWDIGPAAETNPLVRLAFHEGVVTVTLVNFTGAITAVLGLALLVELLETPPSPNDRYLAVGIEMWPGGLVAVGH